jgi:3-hydroxybutyrate dehydrogenase
MAAGRARDLGTTIDELHRSVPLQRLVEPSEVAALALYLVSPLARSLTGQSVSIDGGFLA